MPDKDSHIYIDTFGCFEGNVINSIIIAEEEVEKLINETILAACHKAGEHVKNTGKRATGASLKITGSGTKSHPQIPIKYYDGADFQLPFGAMPEYFGIKEDVVFGNVKIKLNPKAIRAFTTLSGHRYIACFDRTGGFLGYYLSKDLVTKYDSNIEEFKYLYLPAKGYKNNGPQYVLNAGKPYVDRSAPIAPPIVRLYWFAIKHPGIALEIGDYEHYSTNISTNSQRFAESSGVPEPKEMKAEGTHLNAMRHVVWQATISSRFGEDIAEQAGNGHEHNPNVDLSLREFYGQSALDDADQTIDLLNNIIGRAIGKANPHQGMRELTLIILKYFHETGLYLAEKTKGGYKIVQTKLTDAQYKDAVAAINTTDENGFTPKQKIIWEKWKQEQQRIAEENRSMIRIHR